MKKNFKYTLAKNGGKLYRDYLEPSAFKGAPAIVDKVGSKITNPLFHEAAYGMVGALGYKRGINPALGSVAYTGIHTLLKLLFCWVFIIGGAGEWLLTGLWNILKVVFPFACKVVFEIAKFIFPLAGKLLCGFVKIVGIGCFKIVSGIIGAIF